jgi:hypothetical protein
MPPPELIAWVDDSDAANSMVSLAEFDAHLSAHAFGDAALDEDAGAWTRALLTAQRHIDALPLAGRRTEQDQPLSFPRAGLTDDAGRTVASDSVPGRAKRAQMEWALLTLSGLGDPTEAADTPDEVQIGPLRVVERRGGGSSGSRAKAVPDSVRAELGEWYMGGRIRMVRG